MDNQDNQENTAKIKMAGNELLFVYLLHLAILIPGMVVFAVLSADPEYREKRKLEEVSTISMEVMLYAACPTAFLLSIISQLVFDPWKLVRSKIDSELGRCLGSCWNCKPLPRSKVLQRRVQLQGGKECSCRESPAEEIREIPAEGIQEAETVATVHRA